MKIIPVDIDAAYVEIPLSVSGKISAEESANSLAIPYMLPYRRETEKKDYYGK